MFDLANRGAFHWYHLFIILTLDKATPFLDSIGFPLTQHIEDLRGIGKSFILSFYEIVSHLNPSEQAEIQSLFDNIYNLLVSELGKNNADKFCEWGNQQHIDGTLKHSLRVHEELLISLVEESSNHLSMTLSVETFQWLNATILEYHNMRRELGLALDTMDEAERSDWEKQLTSILNYDNKRFSDSVEDSPYTYLWLLITIENEKQLLRRIKNTLTDNELKTLESMIQSTKRWEKDQAHPTPLYFRSYTLSQLLEAM